MQPVYNHFFLAEWVQSPNLRIVALLTTSAYADAGAWDVTIPDLTPAGWQTDWGLRPNFATETFFSAEGSTFPTTVPSSAKDHGIVMSASRTTLPPAPGVSPRGSAWPLMPERYLVPAPARQPAARRR